MRERRKGILVQFRDAAQAPFADQIAANELWIGLDGPDGVTLRLTGMVAADPPQLALLTLSSPAPAPSPDLPPYGLVLRDVLSGRGALSVCGDEAKAAWKVLTPVLEGWDDGLVTMEDYPAGSSGPAPQMHDSDS